MSALDRAIQKVGGVGLLAEQIGVGQTAVSNWRTRNQRVRPEYCAAIEKATNREVRRWDLRPDDWHSIWPELLGSPDAPSVGAQETHTGSASEASHGEL
jgi:DNA-binding transcriptional regulator YdaS (Cro superfamily)